MCGYSVCISDAVMKLTGYRRADDIEHCLVFDSPFAEIQPDEAVPLLKHVSRQSFEMAPVHVNNRHVRSSDALQVNTGEKPSADINSEFSYFQTSTKSRSLR